MKASLCRDFALRQLLLVPLCLTLAVPAGLAQPAPGTTSTPPNRKDAIPVVTDKDDSPRTDDIVVMSPFEVSTSSKGYYAANTMSGTRFNTKLADLASSVTIMTKEQMSDFAMLDANDVFLYVAGTEGTGTYTDYTLDRNGSLADNVQLNPTQANRVRGIGSANTSLGNIETMGRVPIDPITIDALEISRGANANVFGLGNPSGTVNQVPATANLSRNRTTLALRVDALGGHRASLDVNRVLLKDKLAIRGSAVYQDDEFQLKPSGVRTERYNGMIKYQPFKLTTISFSSYNYHAYGNRPNSLPPRDNLSYWLASGKPTWDPVTMTVHVNGATLGPYTAATYNGPDYFNSSYLGNNHSQMFIDQSGLSYWSAPQSTTNATGPIGNFTASHFLQTTAAAGSVFSGTAPRPFDQYLFNTTPTVSDRSIYDWTSINLAAPNRFWDRTSTNLLQIDQLFLNSPTQTLAAQLAFMREDSDRWARNFVGIANDNGQSGQLMVDINERLLDGTPNPFLGRPYLAVDKPRIQENPQKWDTSRAQLAYRLDLTEEKNLLKWLGSFQVTGYSEYKYRVNRQYSWREAMTAAPWIPAGTYTGFQSAPSGTPANLPVTSGEYRFYVGDKVGNNVDYAPGDLKLGTYPFVWGNSATGVFHTDNLVLDQVAADKTGGALNSKTTIRTNGAVVQSHLFDDRLVTTLGVRNDNVYIKYGNPGTPTNKILQPDGTSFDYTIVNGWQPNYFSTGGRTTNVQFVVRPFSNTRWSESIARSNGFLGELVDGLSVNFNKSNSFLPTPPAQDLYRNRLPNTSGSETSWGFNLTLLKNTLNIRVTRYDDLQRNAQTNDINTLAGRVLRLDFVPTGTGNPTPYLNLYANANHWVAFQHPTWTAAEVATEVTRQTGFSPDDADYYINAASVLPIGATSDLQSRGTEVEVNYNPTQNWTLTAALTDNQTVNKNISKALVDWIDERMPTWTTIVDPSITDANAAAENNPGKLWWLHKYSAAPVAGTPASYSATAQTPQANYQAFVGAPLGIIKAQEGKTNPQIRRYGFRGATSYQLAGLTDNKYLSRMTVGGAIRWEDKAAIGYYGKQSLPAIITDLDPNRPIYDKSHTYVDAFIAYKTKLWNDRVGATFQLNARNLGQQVHLQPIGAFPDGTIHTYRIVDSQQFIFSASFDL
ncbi:TonB-dependent receptor [Horticoccus luteus]|uniref:TonB-dependent receptor n=1 Tax=Horticoccus luteus TaxID=2862869 RepID=A0A8F9XM46_9BACT|nr:TonB-dependent receptor [Horticoccus luteus]QYM79674.1 TonB-dependent receptor [Horticoccus luteus]